MLKIHVRNVLGLALVGALMLGLPLLAAGQDASKKAGDATKKAVDKAGDAADTGIDAAGKGVGEAVEHGSRGAVTGAKKTAGALKAAGGAVAGVFSGNDHDDRALIRDVQTELKERGYYEGEIDGISGPLTKAALRGFQRDRDIEVTGSINATTLSELGIER